MLKKIMLAVVILVVGTLATVYIIRDTLVERAVEEGGTYALGVETDLGSAGLELSGGSLELNNYEIRNPEGFSAENIFSIRKAMLDVNTGSLLDDEVVVDSLIIEGIRLNIEQIDTKGNYQVLMDNIKKLDLGESSSDDQHKIKINKAAIRDIQVTGSLSLSGMKPVEKSYSVDNITMTNLGGKDGASVSEITAMVTKKLLQSSLAAGSGILPEGFGKNVKEAANQKIDEAKEEAESKLKGAAESLLGGGKK